MKKALLLQEIADGEWDGVWDLSVIAAELGLKCGAMRRMAYANGYMTISKGVVTIDALGSDFRKRRR
jgi:hypothetical protein